MAQYDQIAEKYKEAEEAITKKYVVEPSFIKLAKTAKNKRVVDLACGSGYFTRKLEGIGASEIVGIDISRKEIELAKAIEEKRKGKIKYFVGDVANFDFSKFEKFDVATAVFLLHYAESKEKLIKICKGIYNSIRAGGKLIVINSDPENSLQSDKKYEVTATAKLPLREGDIRKVTYFLSGKEICSFDTYFWSKKTYDDALKKAGFHNIKWHQIIVSEEGIKKFGKPFWKDLLDNPYITGLTCDK